MKFISTRNKNIQCTAAEAIRRGLAPDGGLFVPDEIPSFSSEEIASMTKLGYPELAAMVLERFLPGFSAEELREYTASAYASFDCAETAPVKKLREGEWILELFHGPTCAFKDFALQMLPYLMSASARKCGDDRTVAILVATSGDTGKAALAGFADVPGTKICVFYPDGGVSPMQRLQMVTQEGSNVLVSAVRGNFDDTQTGVKQIFGDSSLAEKLSAGGVVLSSANSINWGRLAPQIAYYYSAYAQLLRSGAIEPGQRLNFVVPTGNFGDILAGYYAKLSGLPVDKLICASNSNNVLTDFLNTGVYDRNRPFHLTMSPSMDILISSNLERMLYLVSEDDAWVADRMEELKTCGRYDIGADMLSRLQKCGFLGFCADENGTSARIERTWSEYSYAADPHTSVALDAAGQWLSSGASAPVVVLSTASPFKFPAAMLSALKEEPTGDGFADVSRLEQLIHIDAPAPLAGLADKKVRFDGVIDKAAMSQLVIDWLTK